MGRSAGAVPSVRRRGAAVLLLAGILLSADLVPSSGAPLPLTGAAPVRAAIPAEATECVAGWRQTPVPDGAFRTAPFDVISRAGRPAWILGGSSKGVMALRWNGSAWKQAATETRGHMGLVGGDATGRRRVFAVGYRRPMAAEGAGPLEPLSGRIAGSRWTDRRVPSPPGARATLTDVATLAGGEAWAVGTRINGRPHTRLRDALDGPSLEA